MTDAAPRLRPVRWFLAVVAIAGVVLFVVPGHLGLWRYYPFTQLSSMRMLTALGMVVVAAVCATWALSVRSPRPLLRPSVAVALVSLVGAVVGASTVVSSGALGRGVAGPAEAAADGISVLSFNADATGAPEIVEAVQRTGADAVLLVEAPAPVVEEAFAGLESTGFDGEMFTNEAVATSRFDSVGVLVSSRLGSYEEVPGPLLALGSIVLEGPGPGPVVLAAVHPPSPSQFFSASTWRTQLAQAVAVCERNPGAVVGGDFNAVADHLARSGLERCVDATADLGLAGHGTWPTFLPRWVGAGIDHQLSDAAAWVPTSMEVLDVGASDHRAVLVRYAPAA